jgi:predicted GNAT family acetyltransferase
MALARPADLGADAAGVVEVEPDAVSGLMRRWVSDDPKMTAETLDQVVTATAREGRVRAARNLAIRDEAGRLVAMTKLYSDGVTAQVEDVYTVPEWRNRGCARRLIRRAIALTQDAGHELVFIVADDDGWPKHLYSRMGFDPIGRMEMFHRDL